MTRMVRSVFIPGGVFFNHEIRETHEKNGVRGSGAVGSCFFWGPGGGHVEKTVRAALMKHNCHWWWDIGVLKQNAGAVPKHGHVDIQSLQH